MEMLIEYVEEDGNITATIEVNEPETIEWQKYTNPGITQPFITWDSTDTSDTGKIKYTGYSGKQQ